MMTGRLLSERVESPPTAVQSGQALNRERIAMIGLLLVGFGVRVWHLGTQSLWLDEALSVIFSRPNLRALLTILATQDLHPPLYYLVLHFWMRLVGSSEFAVRFVSVAFGLPAIPATFLLGSSLFADSTGRKRGFDRGRQVGLIAATLVALSPFLVYYSQEARMYSALATFGVLSSLALWRLHEEPECRRWRVAYVVFTAGVIYTQYLGGLIVGFQLVYLFAVGTRRPRRAIVGLLAILATAVTYVPWVPGAILQIRRLVALPDFWKGDFQLSYLLTHAFAAFTLGQFAALGSLYGVAAIAVVLVVGGLVSLTWRAFRRGGGEAFVLTYLFVPMGVLYAIVARDPKFAERYLIMVAPPFYLVIALGLTTAFRWLSGVRTRQVRSACYLIVGALGAALILGSSIQVWQIYGGPTYRKDDNRGAIAYIEEHAQPGDVVALMMNTYQTYVYYAKGDVPYEPLQPGGDIEAAADRLNQIVAGRKRLWLYSWNPEWADPSRYVRDSLDHAYTQVPVTQSFTGIGLRLYNIAPAYRFSAKTTPSIARPVNFGNKLRMLGYDLPNKQVMAGESGLITLYWQAMTQPDADFIVSLRLKDGQFYWWRHDDRPAAFNFPTMYWRPGQVVSGDVQFQVPPGTPPGSYDLEIGVYAQGQGTDLNVLRDGSVAAGTAISVAQIDVKRPASPPNATGLAIPPSEQAHFAQDLTLLGSTVAVRQAPRGGPLEVTLWWQAGRARRPDDRLRLALIGDGYVRLLENQAPVEGRYPTNQWTNDEIVVDRHRPIVPSDAPAGPLTIALQVWPADGSAPLTSEHGPSLTLGTVTVLDRQRLTSLPAGIQTPTDLRLGSFARLVGTTLSTASPRMGDHVRLTLYWQAMGSSGDVPYTVFAHVLDASQKVKAQQDHAPGDGNNPTTGWTESEYIVDQYDLTIAPDTSPGRYDIEIGMYNPSDGKRLPVADATGQITGDRAIIASLQIH
jgi:4-amino-4-deoxy-L-arabinose transferase-like glycosyltransferase